LTWHLLAPTLYYGLDCDTGCAETTLTDSDVSGPYYEAIVMTNSLGGALPDGLFVVDTTMNLMLEAGIGGFAGGNLQAKGGSIDGCALTNCTAIGFGTGLTGPATITGITLTGTLGYGMIHEGGTNVIFANNIVPGVLQYGFLAAANVTRFIVAGNTFGGGTSGISIYIASGSNYYNIVNNIMGGTLISDNGGPNRTCCSGNP
jgi:hypothetical protein